MDEAFQLLEWDADTHHPIGCAGCMIFLFEHDATTGGFQVIDTYVQCTAYEHTAYCGPQCAENRIKYCNRCDDHHCVAHSAECDREARQEEIEAAQDDLNDELGVLAI